MTRLYTYTFMQHCRLNFIFLIIERIQYFWLLKFYILIIEMFTTFLFPAPSQIIIWHIMISAAPQIQISLNKTPHTPHIAFIFLNFPVGPNLKLISWYNSFMSLITKSLIIKEYFHSLTHSLTHHRTAKSTRATD